MTGACRRQAVLLHRSGSQGQAAARLHLRPGRRAGRHGLAHLMLRLPRGPVPCCVSLGSWVWGEACTGQSVCLGPASTLGQQEAWLAQEGPWAAARPTALGESWAGVPSRRPSSASPSAGAAGPTRCSRLPLLLPFLSSTPPFFPGPYSGWPVALWGGEVGKRAGGGFSSRTALVLTPGPLVASRGWVSTTQPWVMLLSSRPEWCLL